MERKEAFYFLKARVRLLFVGEEDLMIGADGTAI